MATAAVAALGEVGDERDLDALSRAIERYHWPVPGAATYAIARMAERGVLKRRAAGRLLCKIGSSREPYVRANVAAAMSALAAGPCDDGGPDPLEWLDARHTPVVRAAAARWAHAAAKAGRLDADLVSRRLMACAADDMEQSVARVCAAPDFEKATESAEVYAYATDGVTLLRDRLVAVRLPNGSVYIGHTDTNGHILLSHVPPGKLLLEDPGQMPLEPAN